MHFPDPVETDPSSATLVGKRGIRESVADNNLASSQRRHNDFRCGLSSRGKHQQQLRHGSHFRIRRIEENSPYLTSDASRTRLLVLRHGNTRLPQPLHEQPHLGRFPASFCALKADKQCLPACRISHTQSETASLGLPTLPVARSDCTALADRRDDKSPSQEGRAICASVRAIS